MIQKKSTFPKQQLAQQLAHTLGQTLLEQELSNCLQQIEITQPNAGKAFWQSAAATPGIYIILAGKVRLLDGTDNLITSVGAGASFGELTLFPEEQFQPYCARASVNLKLCYVPGDCLRSLIRKHPSIGQHLHSQAVLWDLLLLCRQTPPLSSAPVEGMMQILPLLAQHNLQIGKLPASLLKEQQLMLLRRGELLHPSGLMLTAGKIYVCSQLPKERGWQVTQPTQLYSLNCSDWETALTKEPQLAELTNSDTLVGEGEQRGRGAGEQRSRGAEGQGSRGAGEQRGRGAGEQGRKANPKSKIQNLKSPEPAIERKNQKKISQAYFPNPTVKIGHLWQRITRRYPYFQQQSASDCGAACLVMVSQYWGKRFSVNRLRDIANVDRNGASLRGLAAAAESIGFTTRPVKASFDKLAQQSLPAIVHWEGKHYIVVYEVKRDRVVVADPALGQRTLSHADFLAGWTGYTLLLQPSALLKETKETITPFWQFFELAKPHWLVLLEVFVASVLLQIFGLITPLFTQLLLDRVVVQRSDLTLTTVGMGLLIFSLFRVAMTGLRQYLLDHTANRVDLALIVGFISHTFRLPLNYFESRYVGDIISRVQENRKIQSFLTGEALSIALDLLTVFVYLGLMFWYSWKMALLVLAIVPPFVLLALIATPFLQRVSREIFGAHNEETGYLIQSLTGIRTVKSMAVEHSVRWHWEELFGKLRSCTILDKRCAIRIGEQFQSPNRQRH